MHYLQHIVNNKKVKDEGLGLIVLPKQAASYLVVAMT